IDAIRLRLQNQACHSAWRDVKMKRLRIYLGIAWCIAATAWAAGGDDLEFARGLRSRNYPDLAVQYLKELSKKPALPAAVQRQIPCEMGKALREQATAEPEPADKKKLYDETRRQLDAFIQANPNSSEAAEAHLESARILVAEAQTKMRRAKLEEGGVRDPEL